MCVKNNTIMYVARTSNNRVISSGDLYCCLLPRCEALRTCRSGFPIATLTCSCGASYIGQTQRNLIKCIEEHRTSLSSSVCRHLQANPDHRVDFHNPEVIGSDNNWRRLQILESLLIQEHKPELNANIPSMSRCIFNL